MRKFYQNSSAISDSEDNERLYVWERVFNVHTKLNTVAHREIVIRNFHLRQLNAIVLNKHLT